MRGSPVQQGAQLQHHVASAWHSCCVQVVFILTSSIGAENIRAAKQRGEILDTTSALHKCTTVDVAAFAISFSFLFFVVHTLHFLALLCRVCVMVGAGATTCIDKASKVEWHLRPALGGRLISSTVAFVDARG